MVHHHIAPSRIGARGFLQWSGPLGRGPNAHLFESIAELRSLTDRWLRVYNQERPHDSFGRVPPLTFLPTPTTVGKSPPWELCALIGSLRNDIAFDLEERRFRHRTMVEGRASADLTGAHLSQHSHRAASVAMWLLAVLRDGDADQHSAREELTNVASEGTTFAASYTPLHKIAHNRVDCDLLQALRRVYATGAERMTTR